jgi:hypothetical protein
MSYYVYGLRVIGERECRYIGLTGKSTPRGRLLNLTGMARSTNRRHPDGLWQWLLDNERNIETFKICKVENVIDGRAMEKAIITIALQLGQRLLNVQHVPDEQRIGYVRTGWSQEMFERRQLQKAA